MDSSTVPLADYFWIAGVDSISYSEPQSSASRNREKSPNGFSQATQPVEDSIAEGSEHDGDGERPGSVVGSTPGRGDPKHSRTNSWQRRSRLSHDPRQSIQTFESVEPGSSSNRSSMTIRAVSSSAPTNGATSNGNGMPLGDFDFDKALMKFASEREHFLEDLSFGAGVVKEQRPPMTSRAEKVKNEDSSESTTGGRQSPFKKVGGTLRRKISFREMSSVQRRPTVSRNGKHDLILVTSWSPADHIKASVRTSRRLSNYNSVIPPPEPLNADPDMHPLKRRIEPVLLDRYPPKSSVEEAKRRGRFPDYVPMFAFPNDINIVSSDERPRSTWHGFAMTGDDNAKSMESPSLYGCH